MSLEMSALYQTLRELHVVASKYEFSSLWLGRCKSYTTSLEAQGREPSTEALAILYTRLGDLVAHLQASDGQRARGALEGSIQKLQQLQAQIGRQLSARCANAVRRAG